MAIDFSSYAQNYAPQMQGAGQIGQGIGQAFAGIPNFSERFQRKQNEAIGNTFSSIFGDADSYLATPVENWGDLDMDNAATAYLNFKSQGEKNQDGTYSDPRRWAKKAEKKGLLSPLKFMQQYNQQMQILVPQVMQKLQAARMAGGWSDREYSEFLDNRKNLRTMLAQNMSPTNADGTPNHLYDELAPRQTFGEAWKDWRQHAGDWAVDRFKPENILGTLAYGTGGMMAGKYLIPRAINLAKGKGFTAGGGAAGRAASSAASGLPKSSAIGTGAKQTNFFKNAMSQVKGKGMKAALRRAMTTLGTTRGLALLARLGPYGLIAAALGGGAYALYKNKDTYQASHDQRLKSTYGGGPVDTSGAAGIEAARAKLAAYNAKYGK